jgi:tetratricopeptide (TPR) repeat protein
MKTIDFSHFIERYLADEMSEDEKLSFEKKLEGNETLRAEVELRKKTEAILRRQDILNLRSKLTSIEQNARKKEATVRTMRVTTPVVLRYAAAVAVLAVLGSVVIFNDTHVTSDELVSRYYQKYEAPSSQRSGNTMSSEDFSLAMEFFNTNDFASAATMFRKVVEKDPLDMQSQLLNGVSNFEDKKYPEAKESFVNVIDNNNNLFIETARWYLALCYIKTNDKAKAEEQLKVLVGEGGYYSKNSRKILRKIR